MFSRSGGEELAEELVTILEESSEEWEQEPEELEEQEEEEEEEEQENMNTTNTGEEEVRTARVIEVIEGLDRVIEEEEEEHYEGQEAVTIEVEDIEKSLTILESEERVVESVRTKEGLVKAVPAKIVEVGSRVGVLYDGQIYENLAPDSQYYEQVTDQV